jgi:hypothetical protein
MSVSKLSATLQQKILDSLVKNIDEDIQKAKLLNPGKQFGNTFVPSDVTTTNMTRLLTNVKQNGIFGKEGLNDIAKGFASISKDSSKVGYRVIGKDGKISKQAGYAELKKHLKAYIVKDRDAGLQDELASLQRAVVELATEAEKVLLDPDLYDNFLKFITDKNISVEKPNDSVFYIKSLPHATINTLFSEYLIFKKNSKVLVEFISANTDAGHLLGIFNQKLFRAFGANANETEYGLGELSVDIFKNIDINEKEDEKKVEKLNNTFSAVFNTLEYIDFLSSSLKTNPEIFVQLSKEVYTDPLNPKSAAEIQIAIDNSEIGSLLLSAGKKLEKLISDTKNVSFITPPGSTVSVRNPKSIQFAQQLENIFSEIGKLAEVSKQLATKLSTAENDIVKKYAQKIVESSDKFGDILLNAEGSDSVLTAISKKLTTTMTGEKLPSGGSSKATGRNKTPKPVAKPKISKPVLSKPKLTGISSKIGVRKTTQRLRTQQGKFTSLASLQTMLNLALSQQIQQNMGTGTSKNVLNYRSGRLAESAQVTSMSQSREGMITAFYTYQRNPYGTFSEGGAQENPRTRDPKLLIARSIREVLATQVTNRLRAVLA